MNMDKLRQAKRKVTEFLQSPVQNPAGQKWVDSQMKKMQNIVNRKILLQTVINYYLK